MTKLSHKFVEFIPDTLEAGVIYVSIPHSTVVHRCCCGCGREVVTPLTPTDWKVMFDGESVSLNPSIGNWSFACRSHYWIVRNRVVWAEDWSEGRVASAEAQDKIQKEKFYGDIESKNATQNGGGRSKTQGRFWSSLWKGW